MYVAFFRRFLIGLLAALPWHSAWAAPTYDPLALPPNFQAQVLDLSFTDPARQRELPLRVYLPP